MLTVIPKDQPVSDTLVLTPDSSALSPSEPTRLEEFAKTSTAANMSGTYHKTAGFIKRKLGILTNDAPLEIAGRNQQLLGKLHRLVGSFRSAQSAVFEKISNTRIESQAIFRKHGGKLLDVASDFVDDLKTTFLK